MIIGIVGLVNPDKSMEYLITEYGGDNSKWTEVNGLEVHYRAEGKGDTILLLHGSASSLHTWDGWAEELTKEYFVVRMDLPAFGLTGPRQDRDYSIDGYVSFLKSFCEKLGLQKFHLAGNSLGGQIAWNYTLLYPGQVDKLILVDAAGYPSSATETALAFKIARNRILSPIMKYITPKSFVKKNLIQVYGDDSRISPALVNRYHDLTLRPGNRQAFIDRATTTYSDRSDSIPKINHETLILWGDQDTWTELAHAHRFDQDLTNSRLIIYPSVGHVPMEEEPERTVSDVVKFLRDETALPETN